ncbi:hypothetical protein RRG08_059381 [Elysia crispata]|uniref:Uncharacterized protein n=1 Tax=Elysia crispata TaxID=231223 RepID=A0AAE1E6H8_9GAST|nr:hypothetical protein RRG08_059381 [Elysia crispata]
MQNSLVNCGLRIAFMWDSENDKNSAKMRASAGLDAFTPMAFHPSQGLTGETERNAPLTYSTGTAERLICARIMTMTYEPSPKTCPSPNAMASLFCNADNSHTHIPPSAEWQNVKDNNLEKMGCVMHSGFGKIEGNNKNHASSLHCQCVKNSSDGGQSKQHCCFPTNTRTRLVVATDPADGGNSKQHCCFPSNTRTRLMVATQHKDPTGGGNSKQHCCFPSNTRTLLVVATDPADGGNSKQHCCFPSNTRTRLMVATVSSTAVFLPTQGPGWWWQQ